MSVISYRTFPQTATSNYKLFEKKLWPSFPELEKTVHQRKKFR